MTEFKAFHKDPHRAVPFIEYILGFGQLGHSVILFEGHPSAFSKVCRDSDLLLIDGAMIIFLQTDWKDMAAYVMRNYRLLSSHEMADYGILRNSLVCSVIDIDYELGLVR